MIDPTTVSTPAVMNPRLIGAIADLSFSDARTANTPTMEASTPIARAITGKIRPSTGLAPIDSNAVTPRMIDATSVTS
jgi:hypothetical protein